MSRSNVEPVCRVRWARAHGGEGALHSMDAQQLQTLSSFETKSAILCMGTKNVHGQVFSGMTARCSVDGCSATVLEASLALLHPA